MLERTDSRDLSIKQVLIVFVLVLTIVAGLWGANTLAYKTRRGETDNELSVDHISASLFNINGIGEAMKPLYNCVPGVTYDNIVYSKNTCSHPEWQRIRIETFCYDWDGTPMDASKISLVFNEEDWTFKDGYWFYNSVVNPGEKTTPLYTGVHFDASIGNDYSKASLYVNIYLEAVQSENNTESSLKAEGWEIISSIINVEGEDA